MDITGLGLYQLTYSQRLKHKEAIRKGILTWLKRDEASIEDMLEVFKMLATKDNPKFSLYLQLADQIIQKKVTSQEFFNFLKKQEKIVRQKTVASCNESSTIPGTIASLIRYGAPFLALGTVVAAVAVSSNIFSPKNEGPQP